MFDKNQASITYRIKFAIEFHPGYDTVAMKKHVKPHLRVFFMHVWMVSILYCTKGSWSEPEGGLAVFWRVFVQNRKIQFQIFKNSDLKNLEKLSFRLKTQFQTSQKQGFSE